MTFGADLLTCRIEDFVAQNSRRGRPPVFEDAARLTLRLERQLLDQLLAVARRNGRSRSDELRAAIRAHVDREGVGR